MSFGIKPLGDRVVLEKSEIQEKTASGFLLTGNAKEQPPTAKVVAVGPGTDKVTMEVKVGDTVIISQYGGTIIKYMGAEYLILSQKDILAIVE